MNKICWKFSCVKDEWCNKENIHGSHSVSLLSSIEKHQLIWIQYIYIYLYVHKHVSKEIKRSSRFFCKLSNSIVIRMPHKQCSYIQMPLDKIIIFLSSFVYPGLDLLWATRRVFREQQKTFTLPVHPVHAHGFKWSPICLFTFVTLYLLF